jgi:hypothetical protein
MGTLILPEEAYPSMLSTLVPLLLAVALAPAVADRPPAHLTFVEGSVAMRMSDDAPYASGEVNVPLFAGASVTTGPRSRAELALDDRTYVRVAPSSEVRIADLLGEKRTIVLTAGRIDVRLFADAAPLVVDTASGPVLAETPGRCRIPLDTRSDDFDRWSDARDRAVDTMAKNGRWIDLPSYGTVWTPNVSNDWAPYTSGSWLSTGYGPVWITNEPWGWTTYHYGQWLYVAGFGWVWCPQYARGWAPATLGQPAMTTSQPYTPWWGWRARGGVPSIVTNHATNYSGTRTIYQNEHPGVNPPTTYRYPQTVQQHQAPPHVQVAPPPPPPQAPPQPAPARHDVTTPTRR